MTKRPAAPVVAEVPTLDTYTMPNEPAPSMSCSFCRLGKEANAELIEILKRNQERPPGWTYWTQRKAWMYFNDKYKWPCRETTLGKHVLLCLRRNWRA